MTPRMIDLVQESFRKIAPTDELAASIFYARLFQTAPHLRQHFPEDMVGQRRKLMAALGFIVTALKDPDRLVVALQSLGERHVSYGPACTHYDVVQEALLFTLRERLGDDWTDELHHAWARALTTTAAVMRDAGERARLARQAARPGAADSCPATPFPATREAPSEPNDGATSDPIRVPAPATQEAARDATAAAPRATLHDSTHLSLGAGLARFLVSAVRRPSVR